MSQVLKPSFKGKVDKEKKGTGRTLLQLVGGLAVLALLGIVGSGLVIFIGELPFLEQVAPFLFFGLFCGGFVLFLGGGAAVATVRGRIRKSRLSDAELITNLPLKPGQRFEVNYRQEFHRDGQIEDMTVSLVLREWVRYTAGTNTYTDTHDHTIQQHRLPSRSMRGGTTLSESLRFELPTQAIHTWSRTMTQQWDALGPAVDPMTASPEYREAMQTAPNWAKGFIEKAAAAGAGSLRNNELTWHVHVAMKLRGWPDYNQAFYLIVVPELQTEDTF